MSHDHAQLSKIAAAAVLWGTTGVAVALLGRTTTLTPITIGFYRLAIAAVALLALTYLRRIAPLSGTVRYVRAAPARRGALSLRAASARRGASSLRAAPAPRAASSLRAARARCAESSLRAFWFLRSAPFLGAAPASSAASSLRAFSFLRSARFLGAAPSAASSPRAGSSVGAAPSLRATSRFARSRNSITAWDATVGAPASKIVTRTRWRLNTDCRADFACQVRVAVRSACTPIDNADTITQITKDAVLNL